MARKKTPQPAPAPVEQAPDNTSLAHDTSTNQPPADASLSMKLDDLELEAANWLGDGEPIASQDQANQLTALVDAAKKLADEIEATRKAEKEPHLQAGREVDARFKPIAERADKALRKLKNKVGEWLLLVKREKERKEREAQEAAREAERKLREAHEEARRSSSLDDSALEEAEAAAEAAKKEAAAVKRQTVTAQGGDARVQLRNVWLVNIVERKELLIHYLKQSATEHHPFADDLQELLYKHARADVKAGTRSLPGCRIWSQEQAV